MPRGDRGAGPAAGDANGCGEESLLSVAGDRSGRDGVGGFSADCSDGGPGGEAGCAGTEGGANSLGVGSRGSAPSVRGLSAGDTAVLVYCAGASAGAGVCRDAGQEIGRA